MPYGPYPVLAFRGEQDSAKSTQAKLTCALIDPAVPALRSRPRNEDDMAIAAKSRWIITWDNISHIADWLSDVLCRLSTGGGFAKRQLFTDADEILFDARRPVILNGIEDFITRGDLRDRAITLDLPTIPNEERRSEADLWLAFEEARPRILGGLFDELAGALWALPTTHLSSMPRMADFAKIAVAAERGRGADPLFLQAYGDLRAAGHEQAIEMSPIGSSLRWFFAHRLPWEGTATDLLVALDTAAFDPLRWTLRQSRDWPKSPEQLSGMMRRLAPAIRAQGFDIDFKHRQPGTGRRLWAIYARDGCRGV
jgi:hypothetical protein